MNRRPIIIDTGRTRLVRQDRLVTVFGWIVTIVTQAEQHFQMAEMISGGRMNDNRLIATGAVDLANTESLAFQTTPGFRCAE